jgi:hypothetical protein
MTFSTGRFDALSPLSTLSISEVHSSSITQQQNQEIEIDVEQISNRCGRRPQSWDLVTAHILAVSSSS